MGNVAEVIKHGVISSIDPVKYTARVTFADRDNTVSYDLPIATSSTGFMKIYSLPKIKTPVVCNFLGTGLEDGFVSGQFYNENNPPPTTNENLHMIKFNDGTTIVYNASNKEITIAGASKIKTDCIIQAPDFVTDSGISLNNHRTSGVQTGSGTSGVPVP